jgi:hypothetical protein
MQRPVREWWRVRAQRVRHLDPAERALLVTVIIGIAAAGLFVITADSSLKTPKLTFPDAAQEPRTNIVSFTNGAAGYGFRYPTAWSIVELGTASYLSSPNDRIRLSFGVSSSDALARAVTRVQRFTFATVEPIGTSSERIDDARALLSAGLTQSWSGRAIRFLAIAVDGERHTYTIRVAVPAQVNPGRVLPQVERIVSSFQTYPRDVA